MVTSKNLNQNGKERKGNEKAGKREENGGEMGRNQGKILWEKPQKAQLYHCDGISP